VNAIRVLLIIELQIRRIRLFGKILLPVIRRLEEYGSEVGFAGNIGVQVNIDISRNFGFFIQGAYHFWLVDKLSGPGKNVYNSETENWEGDWVIKFHTSQREWGPFPFEWPSNYPPDKGSTIVRDFELDLSGFSIKAGIFIRFK
jgi:hypothetical protein